MPADAERPSAPSAILPLPQTTMAPGVTLNLETVTSAFTPDANSPASATGTASTTATASKSTSPRPASPSHFHHPGSQTQKPRSSPALNSSASAPTNVAHVPLPPAPLSAAHPPAAAPAQASKAPPRPAAKPFGASAKASAKTKASLPKLAPGEKALCERCAIEHDGTVGSGRFCSIRCARKKAAARKWEKQRAKVSADGKAAKADGAKSEDGKSAKAGAAAKAQQGPVAKRQRTTPAPLQVTRPSPVAGRSLHMPAPLSSYRRPALKLAMGFPVAGASSSGPSAGGGQMPFSVPMPRAMGPPLPQSRHAPVTGIGAINSATAAGGGGAGMSRGHVAPVPLRPVPQYYDRPSYSSFTPPYFQSPQAQGGLFAPSPGAAATPPPPPPPTPAPLEAGVAVAHNFAPQAQVSSKRECQSVAEALLTLGTAPSPAPGMMRGMSASPAPGFPRGMTPSPLPGGLPRGMTPSPAPPMAGMMSGNQNGRASSSAPGSREG